MKHRFRLLLSVVLIVVSWLCAHAKMASNNFRIITSVQSGGGREASSDNFQMNSTLGQSSPLLDPADPPFSDFYDLYPGFWYAVMGPKCAGDYDGDGDVDGSDLAEYIFDSGGLDLEVFAANFGKVNCP